MCDYCYVKPLCQDIQHANAWCEYDEYGAYENYMCIDCGEYCDEEDYFDEDELCKRSQEISRGLNKRCMQGRQSKTISLYGDFIRSRYKDCINANSRNKKSCDTCSCGVHPTYWHKHIKTKKHPRKMS